MSKEDIFYNHICSSRDTFIFYVEECNRLYRSGHDQNVYKQIISMHSNATNISTLLGDDRLYALIHDTLVAWNMDQQGAHLSSISSIRDSARRLQDRIEEAYQYKMVGNKTQIDDNLSFLLEEIFMKLQIMDSTSKLVGVSKAMHFLLPDLIMPIDNKFTLTFFRSPHWNTIDHQKAFAAFKHIHNKAFNLVRKLKLTAADADGEGWNTSVPKLIDNAIIGFLKNHKVY